MPFGLDLKSMIVAAVFILFVMPYLTSMFTRSSSKSGA